MFKNSVKSKLIRDSPSLQNFILKKKIDHHINDTGFIGFNAILVECKIMFYVGPYC